MAIKLTFILGFLTMLIRDLRTHVVKLVEVD